MPRDSVSGFCASAVLGLLLITAPVSVATQSANKPRPPSPSGASAAQVGGSYEDGRESLKQFTDPKERVLFATRGPLYVGGKWIEITYGRPLKRGRNLWGEATEYGRTLNAGAPVWRAGANVSTRLTTEAVLVFNTTRVPPGSYTVFVDLKPDNWTFILTTWPVQTESYDPSNKAAVWGAYGYTPSRDVVRVPMMLERSRFAMEQLTWNFADMSDTRGTLVLSWDIYLASVPFGIDLAGK